MTILYHRQLSALQGRYAPIPRLSGMEQKRNFPTGTDSWFMLKDEVGASLQVGRRIVGAAGQPSGAAGLDCAPVPSATPQELRFNRPFRLSAGSLAVAPSKSVGGETLL